MILSIKELQEINWSLALTHADVEDAIGIEEKQAVKLEELLMGPDKEAFTRTDLEKALSRSRMLKRKLSDITKIREKIEEELLSR